MSKEYVFNDPPRTPGRMDYKKLGLVDAIILFRSATGAGLSEAKYWIQTNIGDAPNIVELGTLIHAFYRRHPVS